MKKTYILLFYALPLLFFTAAAQPVCAQERTELISDKTPWSYVFVKPTAKNWTMQYPLPKGAFAIGGMSTDKNWLKNKPYVWMTTKLTLPEDYKPGNLYISVKNDTNIMVFINGTFVYQFFGSSYGGFYLKYIPNLLKSGDNTIAAICENTDGSGCACVIFLTDDQPPLNAVPIIPADGKWSYTFDDPREAWATRFPLPRCKYSAGPFTNNKGLWPKGDGFWSIWMTQVVTMPENYVPGEDEILVQYCCDHDIYIFVNGVEVLRRGRMEGWQMLRDTGIIFRPGKNIVAVRCDRRWPYALAGVDILTRKYTDEEKGDPFRNLHRGPAAGESLMGVAAAAVGDEKELTETELKIKRAMDCFKLGQDTLALAELQRAAEADAKDFQANCILGMYALTKNYDRAAAFNYFRKCVKANAKNLSVLNNYGVAAMENRKFDAALEAWERMAKIDATVPELAQNVGCLMDLMNKKRITLKEPEQLRLIELYIAACTNQNREHNPAAGFLLLPLQTGVGHRPDCSAAFTHEFKRGRQTVKYPPYEVRKTFFAK